MKVIGKKFILLPFILALSLIVSACDTGTIGQPVEDTVIVEEPVTVDEPVEGEVIEQELEETGEEIETTGEEIVTEAEEAVGDAAQEAEEVGEEVETEVEEGIATVEVAPETVMLRGVAGAGQDYMMLASGILGRDVDTPANEDLGDVEDFLIDLTTGNVLFALISHGGFLGIGQDQAAIPLSALSFDETEDELILNVSQEQFETFPEVDVSNDWPIGLDETWDDDLGVFWTNAGFDVSFTEDVETDMVVRASQLMGYGYGAPTAASLGTIIDYIVDLGQGSVEYVILSFTDVALYGDDWTIVPFQVIDPSTFLLGNDIVLDPNVDAELLTNAPRLQAAGLGGADFFNPGWDEGVRTYWTEQGYEFD